MSIAPGQAAADCAQPPPQTAPLAIEAAGLTKRFGGTEALTGVDLAAPAGTVYGLLGPNGAGKTTTVRILATLLAADSGWARVLGHDVAEDPAAVRRRMALAGQAVTVDDDLTGSENLALLGRLAGLGRRAAKNRTSELLAGFGLGEQSGRPVKTYSGGMRRRLDLAASLIVPAEIYFLDEPTTGLDPASRAQVWQIVRALAGRGSTVLLTTQYLDEADQLASEIAVIDQGSVIAQGTPGQLKASVGSGTLRLRLGDPAARPGAQGLLERVLGMPVAAGRDPAELTARLPAGPSQPPAAERAAAALAELARAGVTVGEFALGQPSLDEVFLALTSGAAARGRAGEPGRRPPGPGNVNHEEPIR